MDYTSIKLNLNSIKQIIYNIVLINYNKNKHQKNHLFV